MKRLFFILLILFALTPFAYSEEEIFLEIEENNPKLSILSKEEIQKDTNKNNDASLLKKIFREEPDETDLKARIYYDVINETKPLLSDYTTLKFKEGPIESIKPYFVYQGHLNFNFENSETFNTDYDNQLVDININGKFKAPIEFKLQYNLMPRNKYNYFQTFFKDNYIAFNYIPHHKIYIGHFKVPIGSEGCANSYTLPFFNMSQLSRTFSGVRAIGAKVAGDYSLVDYNIAVTSSDRYFTQFFPGAEFSSWVNIKPLAKTDGKYGDLKIGAGFNIGKHDTNYNVMTTALSYKYKRIGIFAEYGISNGSNGATGITQNRGQGFAGTITYNVTKKLQLLARYDIFDSNLDKGNCKSTEYTAGINYFIKGSSLKLMANYIFRHQENGQYAHRFLIGLQTIL